MFLSFMVTDLGVGAMFHASSFSFEVSIVSLML